MEKAKKKINKTVIIILAIVLVVAMIIGVLFLIPKSKTPNFKFEDCGEISKMSLYYKYGYPQYSENDYVNYRDEVEFYGIKADYLLMYTKEQDDNVAEYTLKFDVEDADDVLSVIRRKCDLDNKLSNDVQYFSFENNGQEFEVRYTVVDNDFVSVTIDYK